MTFRNVMLRDTGVYDVVKQSILPTMVLSWPLLSFEVYRNDRTLELGISHNASHIYTAEMLNKWTPTIIKRKVKPREGEKTTASSQGLLYSKAKVKIQHSWFLVQCSFYQVTSWKSPSYQWHKESCLNKIYKIDSYAELYERDSLPRQLF